MAESSTPAAAAALLLSLLAACALSAAAAAREIAGAAAPSSPAGSKLGGRTVVRDVKHNRLVQDLGRFAVEEHNSHTSPGKGGGDEDRLAFLEVVHAESQVVAGTEYYLTLTAAPAAAPEVAGGADVPACLLYFEATVVVKAWLSSRELVSFEPSHSEQDFHY